MSITVLILLFLFIYYICYLLDVYSYWKKKGVVGPTPWPIVGNYGQVLFRLKTESQLIKKIYNNYPEEKYIGVYMGVTPLLIVNDMTMIKQIFRKEFQYFPMRYTSIALSKYHKSLIVGPADNHWKHTRKFLAPTINKTKLRKCIIESTENSIQEFLNYVEELVEVQTEQDVSKLMSKALFTITCDTILGKRYGGFDEDTELETQLRKVEGLDSWEIRYILESILPHSIFKNMMVRCAQNVFGNTLKTIISALSYRKLLKNQGKSEMNTIADFVLEAQESHNLDDDTAELHLAGLAVAVTAIVSLVASNVAFVLARNPEIQNKCYEETVRILEKHDGKITFETLEEMKYVEMIFQEIYRRHGVSSVIDRICCTKYQFPGTNLVLDKGVRIYVPVEAILHDPKFFPDPDKIIPERFAPENRENLHGAAFMTFGMGPRQCIGKFITQLFLTMTLVRFVQRFKLKPSESTLKEYKTCPVYRVRRPLAEQMRLNIERR